MHSGNGKPGRVPSVGCQDPPALGQLTGQGGQAGMGICRNLDVGQRQLGLEPGVESLEDHRSARRQIKRSRIEDHDLLFHSEADRLAPLEPFPKGLGIDR